MENSVSVSQHILTVLVQENKYLCNENKALSCSKTVFSEQRRLILYAVHVSLHNVLFLFGNNVLIEAYVNIIHDICCFQRLGHFWIKWKQTFQRKKLNFRFKLTFICNEFCWAFGKCTNSNNKDFVKFIRLNFQRHIKRIQSKFNN